MQVIADGEFFLLEWSETSTIAASSIGRSRLTYGGTFVETDDTVSLAARFTYAFAFGDATLKAGPEFEVSLHEGDAEAGVILSLERWTATSFGSVYWLIESHSIDDAAFATVQFGFSDSWGVELTHAWSNSYEETALIAQKRLADGPWSLRLGYHFSREEMSAGVSYNSY